MRTEVCVTIDTEFSIGGAFTHPDRYTPLREQVVNCPVDGRDEGLGFLIETFAEHRISATFFVEALNTAYFGDEPIAAIARRILAAGHDVQLHLHPCWLTFRNPQWQQAIKAVHPNDSCAGRQYGELLEIVREGLAAFERWDVPKPIALRAGSLRADMTLYDVAAAAGIPIGSNIGLSIYTPTQSDLQLRGGRHWIRHVLELPILTYSDFRSGFGGHGRTLTITGSSWPELKSLLWQARKAGVSPVVLLTHPFEFVKKRNFRYEVLRRNRINQQRLVSLCRFLQEHDQDFVSCSFTQGADRWLSSDGSTDPHLQTSPVFGFMRAAQNYVNDRLWWY
ncbi:polysaccharide deacetylase [Rhodospirillaceae bacterium SYSU D60014]|uniref:polysaccharide deacetylase n=1 Tax=Virgifigura deserti TaxID=2268457 RepID=UPI000E67312F